MDCTWCVAPRFIVRRENTKVAASDKLLIVHWQQRRRGWKELWMEDYLQEKVKDNMSELLSQQHRWKSDKTKTPGWIRTTRDTFNFAE